MEGNDKIYLSEGGFQRLKGELQLLKSQRRKEIAERLEYAKSLGDLSENAEYLEAKEEQFANESRVAELENMLRRATLIPQSSGGSKVVLGSMVVMQKEKGLKIQYKLVGSAEADPTQEKISDISPIGRAVIGKKRGEIITVFTPRCPIKYTIKDIL